MSVRVKRELRLFGLWLGVVVVGVTMVSRLDRRNGSGRSPAPSGGAPTNPTPDSPGPATPAPESRPAPDSGSAPAPAPPAPESGVTIEPDLRTVAERSGFERTASHAETVALLDTLEAAHPEALRRASMGTTEEDRDIPLLIVASPPVADAAEARASGKVVVFAFGNIHAGEIEGKEALPALARDIVMRPDEAAHQAILRECVLVLAPIYNADGNERVGPSETNRPGQNGPAEVGQRANATGLDLNRDYAKAEASETRAMLRLLTEWDPHVIIDCHTTNGSLHRYTLTYEAPLTTAAHPAPVALMREMLDEAGSRVERRTGYALWWYGDLSDDGTQWRTYAAEARYGGNYHGLRNRLSALSEAYTYAPYRDRVRCTQEFVRELCAMAAERAADIRRRVAEADRETIEAGARAGDPGAPDAPMGMVALRHRIAPFPERRTVRVWGATVGDGGAKATREPKDIEVEHLGRFEATRAVARPFAYLIPPGMEGVVGLLRAHGVEVGDAGGSRERAVEEYVVAGVTLSERPFQGRRLSDVTAALKRGQREVGPGWWEVRTAQRLGTVAVVLLEPESDDGVAAWGLLGAPLKEGDPFPILRVPRAD